jgi:hypothetical protein
MQQDAALPEVRRSWLAAAPCACRIDAPLRAVGPDVNAPIRLPVSGSSDSSGLSGSTPSGSSRNSGFPDGGVWLPLSEAARRLGVTPDAIRKRIPAGRARARKRGGRWLVWVTAAELAASGRPDEPEWAAEAGADEPEPETGQTGIPGGTGTLLAAAPQPSSETELRLLGLVEKLQEENRNLAGQLGFREAQLQQAHERIRLLEAGPARVGTPSPGGEPEEPEEPERPETGKPEPPVRPWWRFW